MLQRSLPEKVFEKFSQALTRDALSAAQVDSMLVACHHCGVQMMVEADAGSVVVCIGICVVTVVCKYKVVVVLVGL